jgi:hypothetical protein
MVLSPAILMRGQQVGDPLKRGAAALMSAGRVWASGRASWQQTTLFRFCTSQHQCVKALCCSEVSQGDLSAEKTPARGQNSNNVEVNTSMY